MAEMFFGITSSRIIRIQKKYIVNLNEGIIVITFIVSVDLLKSSLEESAAISKYNFQFSDFKSDPLL